MPETAESEQVMQDMIDQGADMIFATSYGHLEFAQNVAEQNPEVVTSSTRAASRATTELDNVGTYFGTVYEPVYLAGIAAGTATETDKLGYVYAFPIPQTLANINAFTLGAQSVNPDAEVTTISTGSWCDPARPGRGRGEPPRPGRRRHHPAPGLHQDDHRGHRGRRCHLGRLPRRCLRARPRGLDHRLGVELGPALHRHRRDGPGRRVRRQSDYNGDFRVGLQTGDNPFVQSPFGAMVDEETNALIDEAKQRFVDGGSPFEGPVTDQDGESVYAEGEQPTYDEVETMDFFVEGVIGTIG